MLDRQQSSSVASRPDQLESPAVSHKAKGAIQYAWLTDWLISLAIFGLALWLRATDLAHFVTADEHNWIYRSGLFLNAFLRQNWPGTSVWLTPAVTTTWLGSAGLAVYYYLRQPAIDLPWLEWLVSFSRNRIDLDILLALRWTMALFTAAMLSLIYGLARQLWTVPVALLGSLFLLTEPHLLAVSRIIGHDAPVTLLLGASLLAFLYAYRLLHGETGTARFNLQSQSLLWISVSGLLAGLAVLSKATALILLPFAGLFVLVDLWQARREFKQWLIVLMLWGGVLWLTFIGGWPAAWVDPLGQTWAVINNAFLSSAGLEDADIQPHWSVPDLGFFYYLVSGAFKISPFLMIGLVLAAFSGGQRLRRRRAWFQVSWVWLVIFTCLFGLFLSLSVKHSQRYILPVFPGLVFIAAWGWLAALQRFRPLLITTILGGSALLFTLNYAPYYFTYFNPLLGGSYTAPRLFGIGWGEGLDEAGRWLSSQPDAAINRVGTRYTATLNPYYPGPISSPVSEELDFVTFYIRQSQAGYPAPEILAYFESQSALHHVILNGIDYAQIYQGPAMIPVTGNSQADLPLAYRPSTIYAPIGHSFTVELLWPANTLHDPLTATNLSLIEPELSLSLNSQPCIAAHPPQVKVSCHQFQLPPDLPRGLYHLQFGENTIGTLKVRLLDVPEDFKPLNNTLAGQVKLAGARTQVTAEAIQVSLAWQAWPKARNDFTIFVQLLDENQQRLAGLDVLPEQSFTSLDRKEVMVTQHSLSLPTDLKPGQYTVLVGLYYFAGDQLINIGVIPLDTITK